MGKTQLKKIIMLMTNLLLLALCLVDKQFIVNYIFASVFTIFIYCKYKDIDTKRYLYYLTLLFAIMGSSIFIPMGEDFILSQINIYYIYLFVYLICIIYDFIKNKKYLLLKRFTNSLNIISILFALYVYFSLFIAKNKVYAIKQLFVYTIMFLLVLMVVIENNNKVKRKETYNVLLNVSIGILVLGTLKIILGYNIEPRSIYTDFDIINSETSFMKRIPTVFYYNPNDYAFVVVLILLTICDKIINSKKTLKYWILFFVATINLIFTSSRTAWIAFFMSLFVLMIYLILIMDKKKIKKSFILIIVSLTTFVGLSFIPVIQPYYGKMKSVKEEFKTEKDYRLVSLDNPYLDYTPRDKGKNILGFTIGGESSVNRRVTLIYDVFTGVFLEKNYLGFGVGNTEQYIMEQNNTYGLYKVHNLWVEILGDFGIPGFALFIIIYIFMLISLLKDKFKTSNNVRYSLYLIAITMLVFGPSSVIIMPVFWIVIGLTYSKVLDVYKEKDVVYEKNK